MTMAKRSSTKFWALDSFSSQGLDSALCVGKVKNQQ
jgi:hypothetical protein